MAGAEHLLGQALGKHQLVQLLLEEHYEIA